MELSDIIEAVQRKLIETQTIEIAGREHLLLAHLGQEGSVEHTLIDLGNPPQIYKRAVAVRTAPALVLYLSKFDGASPVLFADGSTYRMKAILDYFIDGGEEGGRNEHTAMLELRRSAELNTWMPADKTEAMFTQEQLALHLRDNIQDIVGDAASLMELAEKFSVTSETKFRRTTIEQSGAVKLTFEQDEIPVDVRVPETFTINVPLFEGQEPREIVARFIYRVDKSAGTLKLGYRLVGLQRMLQKEFRDLLVQFSTLPNVTVIEGWV